nr:V-type proton ATPase subunit S1 [Leptinotarsa decemlineata]
MGAIKGVLVLFLLFFVAVVVSTEYVPVYMWSTKRVNEKVPALNKVSQHTFEYDILERLKENTYVVVFIEPTLSPEDFAQHDQSSGIFTYLAKLAKSSKVTYLPYVQNPVRALKNLDVTVTELPLEKLNENFEIPQTDILIVNLNDVKDSETRIDMLKRHDAAVSEVYREIAKSGKNVLALYTSHHTSWVAPEEVSSRQKRALPEETEVEPVKESLKPVNGSNFLKDSNVFLYFTNSAYIARNGNETNVTFTYESVVLDNSTKVQLKMQSDVVSLTLNFTNSSSLGYWQLEEPVSATFINATKKEVANLTSGASLYAVRTFSYHCGDQIFSNVNYSVIFRDFQIQVFFDKLADNATTKFGDAYDCVGFTSIPIWTGLFVTTILLMIMTLGITMMLDIRTMDRFDDPKGKTITINAE